MRSVAEHLVVIIFIIVTTANIIIMVFQLFLLLILLFLITAELGRALAVVKVALQVKYSIFYCS